MLPIDWLQVVERSVCMGKESSSYAVFFSRIFEKGKKFISSLEGGNIAQHNIEHIFLMKFFASSRSAHLARHRFRVWLFPFFTGETREATNFHMIILRHWRIRKNSQKLLFYIIFLHSCRSFYFWDPFELHHRHILSYTIFIYDSNWGKHIFLPKQKCI